MQTLTMKWSLVLLLLTGGIAIGEDEKTKEKPVAPDVAKALRESKEFAAKCKQFGVTYSEGVVRAQGEIHYRGGGPCEYLVGVFPAKAHETIVLLDKGPFKKADPKRDRGSQEEAGDVRRPREAVRGLAQVLSNAFTAATFKRGKPFDWDRKTGEVFPPTGETIHIYAEWKDKEGKQKRALMSDWLWNFKLLEVMAPGKFVYTGSLMIEEELPDKNEKKLWLGAEVDGLISAILNTATALMDNTEDGSLDNGAYEAIPIRIPEAGTRVTMAFSRIELEVTENYPALKLPKELIEEKKRRAAEAARKKLEEKTPKKKPEKTDEKKDK